MNTQTIEQTINIKASAARVWRVFTDPSLTRQMGGEYVSDWKVGSSFGWKGKGSTMYTYGLILELEPERYLKHSLLDKKDNNRLLSEISYELKEQGGMTTISAKEVLYYETSEEQLKDAAAGWDSALQAVKGIAEQ